MKQMTSYEFFKEIGKIIELYNNKSFCKYRILSSTIDIFTEEITSVQLRNSKNRKEISLTIKEAEKMREEAIRKRLTRFGSTTELK